MFTCWKYMNVTFMFQFCAEMAIHTRWRLHCLFFLDGWEQIDFTLDTLPWVSMFHFKKILVKLVG